MKPGYQILLARSAGGRQAKATCNWLRDNLDFGLPAWTSCFPEILEWQPSVWCSGLPLISTACRDLSLQHKSSCSLIQIPTSQAFKVYKQEQFRTYWLKPPLILLRMVIPLMRQKWISWKCLKAIRLTVPQSVFTAKNFPDSSQGQTGSWSLMQLLYIVALIGF